MRPRRASHPSRVTAVRSRLCMTAAVVGGLLALGAPADAVAEISKGTASDPAGDSAGAPSQDFVSATAQYDSNGSLTVSATMNGNIAKGPESLFSFGVASYAPPEGCTGVTASLFGFSTSKTGSTKLTGGGTGTASITVSGNTITFAASGPAYANKSFSCMTASVAPKRYSRRLLDQLNPPLWFEGFGPPEPAAPPSPPGVSSFAALVRVKRSTGVGKLAAGCRLPASEDCAFSLALRASVKHGHASAASRVTVGTVRGTVPGGGSGKLTVMLNSAGRKYLRRGSFHAEARGAVKSTAGLVARLQRRVKIKKA